MAAALAAVLANWSVAVMRRVELVLQRQFLRNLSIITTDGSITAHPSAVTNRISWRRQRSQARVALIESSLHTEAECIKVATLGCRFVSFGSSRVARV